MNYIIDYFTSISSNNICIQLIYNPWQQVQLAREFEELLKTDIRFEVLYPSDLGLVCFRLRSTNDANNLLVKRINERKKIYLIQTSVDASVVLRFAVCAKSTEVADIHFAFEEITEVATEVMRLMWEEDEALSIYVLIEKCCLVLLLLSK